MEKSDCPGLKESQTRHDSGVSPYGHTMTDPGLHASLLRHFPSGEERCVKCHCTLGTQKEKTNRCKHSTRKSKCNRQSHSSLSGEDKHWLPFNALSTGLLISPALGLRSGFSLFSVCPPCMCCFPHMLGTLLLIPGLGTCSLCLPPSEILLLAHFFSPTYLCLYSYFFQLVCEVKTEFYNFCHTILYLLD